MDRPMPTTIHHRYSFSQKATVIRVGYCDKSHAHLFVSDYCLHEPQEVSGRAASPLATVNDRCHLAFSHDEFREPRSSLCRSDRWIPRGVLFQRPRHRLIAVASLGRLSRNRSIPVWFTRYPRTALSDRWRSLGITSLMNIGGIRYVHIHS
ncbi:hypothetical protein TNCV_4802171 [Trichonephila clavipes]|nr:hypothetical protein TNCV_4802171 [Trichonephila clavipes]